MVVDRPKNQSKKLLKTKLLKNEKFKTEFSKSQLHLFQPGTYRNVYCGRINENTTLRNKNFYKNSVIK